MAKFFIDRPVFAWVIAIFMMLAGLLSITRLPVSMYPEVAPPTISVSATYPGASAQTVQDSVAQIIEQQMNGIDNMRYMQSTSSADGSLSLTLTFEQGTDPDIAQMQVQNKMQLALPLLPKEVQDYGVTVRKSTQDILMVAGFYSADGSMNETDISDYIATAVQDPISRLPGVGEVQFFGAKYAMRIWLNPDALTNYNLGVNEVIAAITAQNAQVAVGELSGAPAVPGVRLNATIIAQERLTTAEEFAAILIRVAPDGSQVRLGDIARVEKDRENYYFRTHYNGQAAAGLGVRLASGANALATSDAVHQEIARLARYFPEGLKVVYPFDTAPFVRISIEEVVRTLIEAIVLVFLVMYLFLQNIRATLIPTIAVPVVLLGTFAVMAMFGFSINMLSMFGLVLAIGLLVDDAIVVVENVERVMVEEGLSPREATRKSMGQITGALVGIALVLSAVFVPMAFFSGSTGVIYRQFSVTIASAMVLSVIVALVLTPALCASILKPPATGGHAARRGFFGWFNRSFEQSTRIYARGVGGIARRPVRFLLIYALIGLGLGYLFLRIPKAFLPDEDQGVAFLQVTLPPGSTQEQTLTVLKEVEHYFLEVEDKKNGTVESVFTIAGFSFGGRGQSASMGFIKLRDWSLRKNPAQKVAAVADRAMRYFSQMKVGFPYVLVPPAMPGLGTSSGFEMIIQDREGIGHEDFATQRDKLLVLAAQNPGLGGNVRFNGLEDTPQFHIDVDYEKASALGLSIPEINQTLSTAWASTYFSDFVDRGRVKRVYIQADAPYRMMPEDLDRWYVRNTRGEMVPFSDFATTRWAYGPPSLNRFNGFPSFNIQGTAAQGKSSGEAMDIMQQIVETEMPGNIGLAWSGISYEEKLAGDQVAMLYSISLLVVFLCLAALYESWTVPFSVILVVPLGIIGAVLAVWLRGLTNDVYFQVGLLTTVGLSAKNAILIVEFARDAFEGGMGLLEAVVHAARLRLRPILMTSLAFGCGVIPLAISTGAGSGSQNAIGTSVFGGVVTGTLLAIFFVPMFFVFVTKLFRADRRATTQPATTQPAADEQHP
ncbi:MAG: efflux RND transporter permease subunit [Opitutaceae bacterium]|jgi:multidrug efflux pump|nr:efflux RND transporter permease subunit [Opitutaceae bacterium]